MNIEQIESAAVAELDRIRDEKVSTVRRLASSSEAATLAREQAVDADREHATQWANALRAGWDEKQLRKLGIPEPETSSRRPVGRPRGRAAQPTPQNTDVDTARPGDPEPQQHES